MAVKKGFYFSVDSILALGLLLIGLSVISTVFVEEQTYHHISHFSEDMSNALSTIKIREIDDPYVRDLIENGTIQYPDNSVLEQLGEMWAKNQSEYAFNIARNLTESMIPPYLGFGIYAGGEEIYSNNKTVTGSLIPSRKMVSGIEKGKPIRGATSQAFLVGIRDKKTASYIYFGGFAGQGNLSKRMRDIPSDANFTSMVLEADAGGNFDLHINDYKCQDTFSPGAGNMTSDLWDISNCTSLLSPGEENEFTLNFTGLINESFIGGGYIRVEYRTDQLYTNATSGKEKIYLPGIDGIINLYSSFYIPGRIDSMSMNLHFFNNLSSMLNIAGEVIEVFEGNNTEQNITISDTTFASILNYTDLNLTTIPLRFGSMNISFDIMSTGEADVALITDLSGSMDWRMTSTWSGVDRDCEDPNFEDSDTNRISHARCIDKTFVNSILNYSGNMVGLVGYDGDSHDYEGDGIKVSHNLSSDNNSLIQQIENDYNADGGTCICCAIDKAIEMLSDSKTYLVRRNDDWLYNASYQFSPPPETGGLNWTEHGYNDSGWGNGTASLGFGGVSTSIVPSSDVELWEESADLPQPVDFTSGVNTTGNSFGAGAGDDGWDWAESAYGSSSWRDMATLRDNDPGTSPWNNYDGSNRISVDIGGSSREIMDSAAWGIQVYIDSDMYDIIQSGGEATVSFDYEAFDRSYVMGYNNRATEESVWIKARFSTSTTSYYLGYDLDASGSGDHPGDSTKEILWDYGDSGNSEHWHADDDQGDYDMDGDGDYNSGRFMTNVTTYITGPGWYYLDMGAKFDAESGWQGWDEGIVAYFDNIQMSVSNLTGDLYYRKNFTIESVSDLRNPTLFVHSDDNATIYLNGAILDLDESEHAGAYWNRNLSNITGLQDGTNQLAVKVSNDDSISSSFDLEILAGDASRKQYIIVMTDGIAGFSCSPMQYECGGGSGDCNNAACQPAIDDAIASSQEAYDDHGIKVYSVGFGPVSSCYNANYTLQGIASAGNGSYYSSDNATELELIYQQIAEEIISASRNAQTFSVEGNFTKSVLYDDSYIEINYTPEAIPPAYGEITLTLESDKFENCSPSVYIPEDIRILDAKVTSYSGAHWTDMLHVNGQLVYNLSSYGQEYVELGDAFTVQVPPSLLVPGDNNLTLRTGDNLDNSTGCSLNNSLIYTGSIISTTTYSQVLESAVGCNWTIEFEGSQNLSIEVPSDYDGTKICNFTSEGVGYDATDSVDLAVYDLLSSLDFDNDNVSNINIDEEDMSINAIWVPKVPYMWGPSVVEVRAWQ